MKTILSFFVFILAVTSCTQYSSEYKRALTENDSLRLLLKHNETEMNEMLSVLNSIEEDIKTIREAEDFINFQKDNELTESGLTQIRKNMDFIVDKLKKDKKQLSELQNKLNNSNLRIDAMQKTIDRLTKDLSEKSSLVIRLQSEINQKNEEIRRMSGQIDNLSADVKNLQDENELKDEQIKEQDRSIHKVYYCFGTKKELKEQNILTGGGLFSKPKLFNGKFNNDYFIAIDKRQVTEIPLYASKAVVKTNHPKESYSFSKDEDGNLTLKIRNVTQFWSLSNYLVIVVG
ncbi:MAG: hypothetical protein LBR18_04360 [Tannerella sp.]|jgi:predicted  nucleic acid-binding Zn-ribbon protein|nr:hypothetical protein [Tannerella sp.]